MNTIAMRILYDYNAWAHAQVWNCIHQITEDQFVEDTGYSVGSLRNHMVHIASVDARWFARMRRIPIPISLNPADFPKREDVVRLWSVVYRELDDALDNLSHEQLYEEIQYDGLGEQRQTTAWKILLHVFNHGTDHRAQMLYALAKMGVKTPEQDFIYYLRDELPPRGYVEVSVDMFKTLFDYDTYATSRLVSESLGSLSEADLDQPFGYSHNTIRKQLAHLMLSGQYWLERALSVEMSGAISAVVGAGSRLLTDLNDVDLMRPVEYKTATGRDTANIRWEMLWHLINHGTDHRAQTLAMLAELNGETFGQDMMVYFWDYEF